MPVLIPGPGEDVIPAPDDAADAWFGNFGALFAPDDFGLDLTSFSTLVALSAAFSGALATATAPATRTATSVAAKDTARAAASVQFRAAAAAAVTWFRAGNAPESSLSELGLRIPQATRTRIEAPVDAPLIDIPSIAANVVNIRLTQVIAGVPVTDRSFPAGTASIELANRTNDEPFTVRMIVRRVNIAAPVADLMNGVNYDWRATYLNPRGERGPDSTIVSAPAWVTA